MLEGDKCHLNKVEQEKNIVGVIEGVHCNFFPIELLRHTLQIKK